AGAGAAGAGVLAVGHRVGLGGVGVVDAAAERVAAGLAGLADRDHRAVGDAGGHVDVLLLVAGAGGLDGGAVRGAVGRPRDRHVGARVVVAVAAGGERRRETDPTVFAHRPPPTRFPGWRRRYSRRAARDSARRATAVSRSDRR